MIDVTIDRSKWRCGMYGESSHGRGEVSMLNSEGFMCCLGFASLAIGVEEAALKGCDYPVDVARKDETAAKVLLGCDFVITDSEAHLRYRHTPPIIEAATANDDGILTSRQRESKVRAALKKVGMKVEFVGKYHKRKVPA